MSRVALIAIAVLAVAGAGWRIASAALEEPATQVTNGSAADARQREILRDAIGHAGDPDLGRRFAAMNQKHFSSAIPATPVLWEPRLADVGALATKPFTLLGVFGQAGDRSVILLHPSLQEDPQALDRALSHEMVHAYLFSMGDINTNHGESFQNVLRRIAGEGAFVSVIGTAEERAALRTWLDTESKRLETERRDLDALAPQLERERTAVEQAVEQLSTRMTIANTSGRDWPSDQEVAAVNAMRDTYNERAAAMNHRSLDFRTAQDEYNRKVTTYNLMATYPDGMDGK